MKYVLNINHAATKNAITSLITPSVHLRVVAVYNLHLIILKMITLLNQKAMKTGLNEHVLVFITMGSLLYYNLLPCNSLPWPFKTPKWVYWCKMLLSADLTIGVSKIDADLIWKLD